jgi:hypothetical protein
LERGFKGPECGFGPILAADFTSFSNLGHAPESNSKLSIEGPATFRIVLRFGFAVFDMSINPSTALTGDPHNNIFGVAHYPLVMLGKL